MPEQPFLGDGHQQILAALNAQVDALVNGQRVPRAVVLSGPSGIGKSRIIRELYRSWERAQPAPAYWPSLPEESGTADGVGALENRKVIGPPNDEFTWAPSALPAYSWWAFNCARMTSGVAVDVISQGRSTIRHHLLPALLAWRRSASVVQRLGGLEDSAMQRVRELVVEGRDDLAAQALEALGVVVPGLSLIADWGQKGFRAIKHRRGEYKALMGSVNLGKQIAEEQSSEVKDLAKAILAVSSASNPAIVVVEDIHLMGDTFSDFLSVLQTHNPARPVLIVASAWPEGHYRPSYSAWRESSAAAGEMINLEVPQLGQAELLQFVFAAAPSTSRIDAQRLVGHFPNPLALQLFLGLKSTSKRIRLNGGKLVVKDQDLANLPRGQIRDLYRAMWAELPFDIREILSLAAGTLPEHSGLTWPFLENVVISAGVQDGDITEGSQQAAARALRDAADLHRWTVRGEIVGSYTFREAVLDDIAVEELDADNLRGLRDATIAELRLQMAELGEWWLEEPALDQACILASNWLWYSVPSDRNTTQDDVTAGRLASAIADAQNQAAQALRIMNRRPWRQAFPQDHYAVTTIDVVNAYRLEQIGQYDKSLAELKRLLPAVESARGIDSPDALSVRMQLAKLWAQIGQVKKSVNEARRVIQVLTRLSGSEHVTTLSARGNLANLLFGNGAVDAAVVEMQRVVDSLSGTVGSDHADALSARSRLAVMVSETRPDKALDLHKLVLVDRQRVLGADHPQTLTTRSHIAYCLQLSTRYEAAIAENSRLLKDRLRVLGPDHRDTFTSRARLAICQGLFGLEKRCVTGLRELITDQSRVLGSTHADTLTTRLHLLEHEVDDDAALAEYSQLLADSTAARGAEDKGTLTIRHNLAERTGRTGQVALAIHLYDVLLQDRTRILGANHPHTAVTRQNLANWRAVELQ